MSEKLFDFIERNSQQVIFALLVALVLIIYWQTVGFEFINFDDNIYVYENPFVAGGLSADGIYWAFTKFYSANWHPLTWITHQFDVSMFGLNAGSHHATNVLFHLVNTILAFSVFKKLSNAPWKSAMIAALFAVHPAHVESVAWISERKDVLSTMFWLLTMLAYTVYAQNRKSGDTYFVPYAAAVILFALGLMSKPMLVTLPFVLLLIDFWPLERFTSFRKLPFLVLEKIPFFLLTIASAIVTVFAQRSAGAVQTLEMLPFKTRFLNSILSYAKYIAMLIYPVNLSVWYPYEKTISTAAFLASLILLVIISAFCIFQINRRKYLIVGWLWFLGTMVPVIGLVQVGLQSLADRYTYVSYFGLFIIIIWGADEIAIKSRLAKRAIPFVGALIVLIFATLSFIQVSRWKSNETLYRHSIAATSGNFVLMQNYCHALTLYERLDDAETQCANAILANPEYSDAYNSLGILELKTNRFEKAAESFENAIKYSPDFPMYRVNLAVAYSNLGKPSAAEDNLRIAASSTSYEEHKEIWIDAIIALTRAYTLENNFEKANESFVRALTIAPERVDIRANFALFLMNQQKPVEAQKQIEIALNQNPNIAESHYVYGMIHLEQNNYEQAVLQFEMALKLKPELKEVEQYLEKAKKEGSNK